MAGKSKLINQNKSASKHKYSIRRGKNESTHKYLKRLVFDAIIPRRSAITVGELVEELKELTGHSITKWFLLSTLVFPGSGLVIEGDTIYASSADRKTAGKIKRLAIKELTRAEEIERNILFQKIREEFGYEVTEAALSQSLFKKNSRFVWKVKKTGLVFAYQK